MSDTNLDVSRSCISQDDTIFEKLVWNIEDVRKVMGCSQRHVRKLVSLDKIPFAKVGKLIRFSPARICEWLQKGGTR